MSVRHLLTVWNPSSSGDALDTHLAVLLKWSTERASLMPIAMSSTTVPKTGPKGQRRGATSWTPQEKQTPPEHPKP